MVPLAALIAATLGSILGPATPTEAAVGAFGASCWPRLRKRHLCGRAGVLATTATSSMVLFLAVTSNIFGAVFSRLGTADWVTKTMLGLPLSPVMMLIFVVILLFLLGWPFEWPAIILVFLPIFFPIIEALRPDLANSLGIAPDMVMIWFGALVALTMQTAYLSPPVAMSAYYLKQVVREWSLATIYKGMFEFMALQCVAIALLVAFPPVATWFPEYARKQGAAQKIEKIDDSKNRLEEDPLEFLRRVPAPKN